MELIYTPEQAAERLKLKAVEKGPKSAKKAVEDLARFGKLPGKKVGRSWRFTETQLLKFLNDSEEEIYVDPRSKTVRRGHRAA